MNPIYKHKHHNEMVAFASGKQIQYLGFDGVWYDIYMPNWLDDFVYRVKPDESAPKDDIYEKIRSRSTPGYATADEIAAADEIERLRNRLAAEEESHAESLQMYRRARDERDRLRDDNIAMRDALIKIANWDSHPPTLAVDYGAYGVRDFYRTIAYATLHPF